MRRQPWHIVHGTTPAEAHHTAKRLDYQEAKPSLTTPPPQDFQLLPCQRLLTGLFKSSTAHNRLVRNGIFNFQWAIFLRLTPTLQKLNSECKQSSKNVESGHTNSQKNKKANLQSFPSPRSCWKFTLHSLYMTSTVAETIRFTGIMITNPDPQPWKEKYNKLEHATWKLEHWCPAALTVHCSSKLWNQLNV